MTDHRPPSTLDLVDWRVGIVLGVLAIDAWAAAQAFRVSHGGRPTRVPGAWQTRQRITAALGEMRYGGVRLSGHEIAGLVGAPNHSTVIHRCRAARRLGLLTESEIHALRRGEAPVPHAPATPAGEHA